MFGLKPRRIDEYKLAAFIGVDAMNAMTRSLRLARGDTDLLSDQMIEQGGFAHIRPTDDGDVAAAKCFNQAVLGDARRINIGFSHVVLGNC